jgi:branched-chain amino acid transport system substrate-binding protein
MKKIWIGLTAVIIIVGLGWFFLGKQEDKKQETIKIGAVLPLTGKFADAGNSVKAGLEIAIRELQKTSNKKYDVIYYDTKSEVKNAISGYQKLKSVDKVNLYFTNVSDHCLALKPLAIKDSTLLFCIASHTEITNNNANLVFRPTNTGVDEANYMINYITDSLHDKKIFFYAFNTEAGIDLEKAFKEKLSANLIGTCLYDEDMSIVRNITTASTFKNADCIAVIGYTPIMGRIIKSLRESGYKNPILTNVGFNTPSVIESTGDYAKSVLYVDYDFPYKSKQHFERDSIALANYHTSFTVMSYVSFGSLFIIDDALNNVNGKATDIGKYISKHGEYDIEGMKFTSHPDGSITSVLKFCTIE